ncbi:hypothetical protein K9M41_01595 [Candidatus Gracilibacteria bacterium]|nr:hypothetical protein [Candidatus Gracilibacteria bacterium]
MAVKKYHFEGLGKDGKTLSGFLFSETKEDARAKLKKDGIAILSIEPFVAEQKGNKSSTVFEFKAIDDLGKEKRGHIEAENQYEAYKKLRLEYDFTLIYLVPQDLSQAEKLILKKKGISPELEKQFLEDEKNKKTLFFRAKEKKEKRDKVETMLEDKQKEMQFLQAQVDVVIREVKKLLQDNSEVLDPNVRRNIQERIDRLSRLRQSSSLNHLESMMKRLFAQLARDDIFLPVQDKFPDFQIRIDAFKKVSGTLKGSLSKGLSSIQIGTDLERFQAVIKMKPLHKVFFTLYWACVFLFFMLLNFWGLNVVKLMSNYDVSRVSFYFSSGTFWFVTLFSGIITLLFAFDIFAKKPLSVIQKTVLCSGAILLALFFVIEFPVFFSWTV